MHRSVTENHLSKSHATNVERRRDTVTRAVVTGLKRMHEDMEKLADGPEKKEAMSAVDRFAKHVADALWRWHAVGDTRATK